MLGSLSFFGLNYTDVYSVLGVTLAVLSVSVSDDSGFEFRAVASLYPLGLPRFLGSNPYAVSESR